ncbi:vacuolar membrane protein [Paracoccidioides lutzii Pb01]|uniref:Vacuolar membrane protein n=1 Tax=Paracoccidioides lutzii (strain ATCC MYA-826 / Pb01) TaxID=502779 RepID=C1H336_PARBA|nr:vacuolar membrane protein [Paracoccidioides lutzii Pb01]EEH34130.2 vacuolar membrane protein [Paracoccidioides lutzii Pb01]
MAPALWKTFNFFEVSPVQFPDGEQSIFDSDVSCICTGSENLFLGTTDGTVHILSQSFKVLRTFKAHDTGSITHMRQVDATSLIVTISEDLLNDPVLKVWALDKEEKKTGAPKCLSTVMVQNGRRQFPVSAFVVLPDLSQLAVGFANGSVTVIRGDLIHDRGAKQRTVFESEEPVTGLEIQHGPVITLYISTTGRILTLVISGKGQGQPARALEDLGCGVGCMTFDHQTGDIIIAREDAIYTYGPGGRGPSFAFDSPKTSIYTFRDYIALVCPPKSALAKSDTLRRFGGVPVEEILTTSMFTILEPDLKFIAHSESLASKVKFVFMEWGDLFIVTVDGKVSRYREKALEQKLEILYQRNLYILAINLAQKAGVDKLQQNVIFRKYGDYLYQKADYDTAMQQYLRAIDNTEPSQVIRKFLDTQRIHNLIEYLEELHDHEKATADHTTLLLNCYAKLKDTTKLDSFIKAPGELKFDPETAIAMCRQGGYYEQAAYLATKHNENDMVVDILIEDSQKYADALKHIGNLEPGIAYPNLMRYARVLLGHCPHETTNLFIEYYTGQFRPRREPEYPSEENHPQPHGGNPIQNLTSFIPIPGAHSTKAPPAQPQLAPEIEPPPEYEIPKPRNAFSAFVDQPQRFIEFLEALIKHNNLKKEDKIDLYTTLFEMYLDTAKRAKDSGEREEWEGKAKKLIEGKDIPVSTSNVLLLSDLSNFREGTKLVQEQQGLCSDIFRSYTSAKDTAGVIKALRKYGPQEPQLYMDALAYFSSSPKILEEAGDELYEVLKKIDHDGLMAPLQVIQALSNNTVVTMGMIKKYLSDNIERERKEIANNRRLISSYTTDTDAKQKEIAELGTKPFVFQARSCSSCHDRLDLPTVHFLCKHSFHQRCLNRVDKDAECPVCAPQNATIRAIRERQIKSADQHELFKSELQRSRDRFGTTQSKVQIRIPRVLVGYLTYPLSIASPLLNKMSSNFVIQDSDDSEAELSDIATSIDPLQDNSTSNINANSAFTPHGALFSRQPKRFDRNDHAPGEAWTDNDSFTFHGPLNFDSNVSVIFSQFIASQSQDQTGAGEASLSQQQREKAWIGERESDDGTGDGARSSPMKFSERGVCSSSRKSILKRGRTMSVDDRVENAGVEGKNAKRRRTMDMWSCHDEVGKPVEVSGRPEQGNDDNGIGSNAASEQIFDADCSSAQDLVTEATNTPNHLSPEATSQPLDTSGAEFLSRKLPAGRSKSSQIYEVTGYDTEMMSSATLARAHRRVSASFISDQSESLTNCTRDELALPPMFQGAIAIKKSTSSSTWTQMKVAAVERTTEGNSDRDELDCIEKDFGDMPQERYKPRPSGSRSKVTVDTRTGVDGGANGHIEVVLQHENSSSVVQNRQQGKDRDFVVTQFILDQGEEDPLNASVQGAGHDYPSKPDAINVSEPHEIPKRPRKAAKKKVKRGKTTSVMMTRAIESDVEDDVIWMDEKPADVTFKYEKIALKGLKRAECYEVNNNHGLSNGTKNINEDAESEVKTEDERAIEYAKQRDMNFQEPVDPPAPASVPAPKKRGRKRKKTTDTPTNELPLPAVETKPSIEERKKDIQPLTKQDQNIIVSTADRESEIYKPIAAVKGKQPPQTNEQDQENPSTEAQVGTITITVAAPQPIETPKKPSAAVQKGPDKHSPITINKKVPYRVGLSRTARIAPLLKLVRK